MADFWWSFALIQALFTGAMVVMAHKYGVAGVRLIHMRSVVLSLFLSPILFLAPLPSDPAFYIGAIGIGVLGSIADSLVFASSAIYGAGATSRLLPMSIVGSFVFWFLFEPSQMTLYMAKPLIGVGIVLALLLSMYAISSMRKGGGESGAGAFKMLLPAVMIYAVCDSLNKISIDTIELGWGNLYFIFFLCITMAFTTGVYMKLRKQRLYRVARLESALFWKVGLVMATLYLCAMLGRTTAMFFTINPAFASVIGLSVPIWVLFYNIMIKSDDAYANIGATFLFVLAASLLIVLSGLI